MNAPAFVRTFKVGPHRVTLTIPFSGAGAGGMRCKWEPLPRRLSKKRMAEYLAKRDACLRAFATWAGISVFVATPDSGDYKTIDPDPQP